MIAGVGLGTEVDLKARVGLGSRPKKLAPGESRVVEPNILTSLSVFAIILLPYTIAPLGVKSLSSSLMVV